MKNFLYTMAAALVVSSMCQPDLYQPVRLSTRVMEVAEKPLGIKREEEIIGEMLYTDDIRDARQAQMITKIDDGKC